MGHIFFIICNLNKVSMCFIQWHQESVPCKILFQKMSQNHFYLQVSYDLVKRTTRFIQTNTIPRHIAWHPTGCLLFVSDVRSQLQVSKANFTKVCWMCILRLKKLCHPGTTNMKTVLSNGIFNIVSLITLNDSGRAMGVGRNMK